MDVMTELSNIGPLYKAGQYEEGLQKIKDLWDRIKDPRESVPNAYLVVEYAVAFSLALGELEAAWEWAQRSIPFRGHRHDMGEAEFLIGKVAYARNDLEAARTNFLIANRKSRGRAFQGVDPRYKALIAKPKTK